MKALPLLLMPLLLGQPDVAVEFEKQLALIVKARQEKEKPQPLPPEKPRWMTYKQGESAALTLGQFLVLGIGCDPPTGNWVFARTESLEGFDSPCVSVSWPSNGKLWKYDTFPQDVTSEEIAAYLWPPKLSDAPRKKSRFQTKWNPYAQPKKTSSLSQSFRGGSC